MQILGKAALLVFRVISHVAFMCFHDQFAMLERISENLFVVIWRGGPLAGWVLSVYVVYIYCVCVG